MPFISLTHFQCNWPVKNLCQSFPIISVSECAEHENLSAEVHLQTATKKVCKWVALTGN